MNFYFGGYRVNKFIIQFDVAVVTKSDWGAEGHRFDPSGYLFKHRYWIDIGLIITEECQ